MQKIKATKRQVATMLRKGAKLLDELPEKWIKNSIGLSGDHGHFCALGAVSRANKFPPAWNGSTLNTYLYDYVEGTWRTGLSIKTENDKSGFEDYSKEGAANAAKILRAHARRLDHGGAL